MTVAAPPAEDLKLVQFARRLLAECRPDREPLDRLEAELLAPIREWCTARADKGQAAYVTPPEKGNFEVYVITRAARYDDALAREVHQLGRGLFENGWQVSASHLPVRAGDGDYLTFFDPQTALLAYADR